MISPGEFFYKVVSLNLMNSPFSPCPRMSIHSAPFYPLNVREDAAVKIQSFVYQYQQSQLRKKLNSDLDRMMFWEKDFDQRLSIHIELHQKKNSGPAIGMNQSIALLDCWDNVGIDRQYVRCRSYLKSDLEDRGHAYIIVPKKDVAVLYGASLVDLNQKLAAAAQVLREHDVVWVSASHTDTVNHTVQFSGDVRQVFGYVPNDVGGIWDKDYQKGRAQSSNRPQLNCVNAVSCVYEKAGIIPDRLVLLTKFLDAYQDGVYRVDAYSQRFPQKNDICIMFHRSTGDFVHIGLVDHSFLQVNISSDIVPVGCKRHCDVVNQDINQFLTAVHSQPTSVLNQLFWVESLESTRINGMGIWYHADPKQRCHNLIYAVQSMIIKDRKNTAWYLDCLTIMMDQFFQDLSAYYQSFD